MDSLRVRTRLTEDAAYLVLLVMALVVSHVSPLTLWKDRLTPHRRCSWHIDNLRPTLFLACAVHVLHRRNNSTNNDVHYSKTDVCHTYTYTYTYTQLDLTI
jgi:hypothetical protein